MSSFEKSSNMAQLRFKTIIVRSILIQEPVIVLAVLEKIFRGTALCEIGIFLFANPESKITS